MVLLQMKHAKSGKPQCYLQPVSKEAVYREHLKHVGEL